MSEQTATHTRRSPRSYEEPDGPPLEVVPTAKRGLVAFVVLVGATLALGGVGRLFVFDSSLGELDNDVVQWFADHRNTVFDTAAEVGAITDTWTAIGVMFGAMTILVSIRRGRLASLILIAMALELGTFLVVGAIIDRPRPEVEATGAVPSTPSFPSGHAAGTVALYGSLLFAARRVTVADRVGRNVFLLVPAVFALLVAVSRVYDGVHYPSDVLAGLLMGAGAFAAALYVTDLVREFRQELGGGAADEPTPDEEPRGPTS